jgi:hypothetical protein
MGPLSLSIFFFFFLPPPGKSPWAGPFFQIGGPKPSRLFSFFKFAAKLFQNQRHSNANNSSSTNPI